MKKLIEQLISFSMVAFLISCNNSESKAQGHNTTSVVKIVGAMSNVMHKGELFGTIDLDSIGNKTHLYGLGPVEYLAGESVIVNGRSFKSTVAANGSIAMEETFKVKAPFFAYATIDKWKEIHLPDNIQTIPQLEEYLQSMTKKSVRPFLFKINATVDSAEIHIVNLPKGAEVHSPNDAHQGEKAYSLNNEQVQLIGFFSTEHQAIFTHHDTFVHIHLITGDNKKMGHLDKLVLKKGTATLYLPED